MIQHSVQVLKMHPSSPPLTADNIDDLLYLTRVNETEDLKQAIAECAKGYGCTPKQVLEVCIDPETGNSVLHYCSANGFIDLLQLLLGELKTEDHTVANGKAAEWPSLVNKQNAQGNTSLHWAAYNGHLEVVKALVNAGADMWIKNTAGHLAMFEAERADKSDVVQFLLEAGGREVERVGMEGVASQEDEAEAREGVVDGEVRQDVMKAEAEGNADAEMTGTH